MSYREAVTFEGSEPAMSHTCNVLVIDDDEDYRELLRCELSRLGHTCTTVEGGGAGLDCLKTDDFDVAFIDLFMPEMDGLAVLAAMKEASVDAVPILITGGSSVFTAAEAMRRGAFDYVKKESDFGGLPGLVERAARFRRANRKAEATAVTDLASIPGDSSITKMRPGEDEEDEPCSSTGEATETEKQCNVLVVDDGITVRQVLRQQLTHLGYTCETAENGSKGLEALRSGDFDVVLIDLLMPEMDGLTLLAALKEARLDTVAVVMSGCGTVAAAVEAMKGGAFDFIEKSADLEVLRGAVERASRHQRLKRHARNMETLAQRWEETFNAVPDLIGILDNRDTFVRVNKAMAERLGCQPEEAVGLRCCVCLRDEAGRPPSCPRTMPLEGCPTPPCRLLEAHRAGHFLTTISPFFDEDGKWVGGVYVARDIAQEVEAKEKLRKAHIETERVLAGMSAFLIEVDTNLRVCRWNAAAERTLGPSPSKTMGKPLIDSGITWD